MGTRALSKIQYGKETMRGTAVAATKILAGAQIKGVPSDQKPEFIADALGVKAQSNRVAVYEKLVEDTITIEQAYFQILPFIFSLGLKGNVTATEVTGSQLDYLWAFTPSLTATNAPDTVTLEVGDDVDAFEIEFAMIKRIKISGEVAQDGGVSAVAIEVEYFGRQVTKTSFTGALSLPTMTTMNAKLATLFKDALWSNKGVTEVANVLRGFEFEIINGFHPKMMGSANKYFNTFGESFIDVMLTLTLEGVAAADDYFDDWKTDPPTAKAHAIKIVGPQIGSGATHYLHLFVWGAPELVVPLDSEVNGNNLHQVLIHGQYGATGAQIVGVDVSTNINAI